MSDDPLSNLLLDADEIDRASLARALHAYVGIDNNSGKIIQKASFSKLNARQKVLAYLLGKKVAKLLGKIEIELTSPKDITGETGIPKGTVNPKLRELVDNRFVSQTKEGEYYIESHQILACVSELENKEENEKP
jgi:hypothetical protein